MKYTVVNMHWKKPYDFYCGRPKSGGYSPLGNPYDQPMNGKSVVELFRLWLWKQLKARNPDVIRELNKIRAHTQTHDETKLACWCVPHKECHVQIIIDALNSPEVLEILDEGQSGFFPDICGLTLLRPWPWAFTDGGTWPKRVENRMWQPPASTDWIALHAGKGWDVPGDAFLRRILGPDVPPRDEHPTSQIFAVCRLGNVLRFVPEEGDSFDEFMPPSISDWAFGPYCWVLTDFVPLLNPIPCGGARNLWPIAERPGLLEQLEAAYAESLQAANAA